MNIGQYLTKLKADRDRAELVSTIDKLNRAEVELRRAQAAATAAGVNVREFSFSVTPETRRKS